MASITIRQLDEATKAGLRIRAAHHGHSMEQEAREILREALGSKKTTASGTNLAKSIRRRFAPLGGVRLPKTPREPVRKPPEFGG